MIFTLVVLILSLIIIRPKPELMIYGWFAGECFNNCGTMYKVTATQIYKDTTSYWSNSDAILITIRNGEVSKKNGAASYNDYKLNIPLIMLMDQRYEFGCPDCYDQGGYYLQFKILGKTKSFKIEKGQEPFYYPNLVDDIETMINMTKLQFQE
ncbi:hypothetical protein D770_04255 [Flammeovirgaceae bacterium 311]|nr:hypothetical protein D770_04255 [Flammeovirgaceae bacterium 311]